MVSVGEAMGVLGADVGAGAAAGALVGEEGEFGLAASAFGVMAPDTAEGAPLQEDGGADAGAVMDGEAFDVNQATFHRVVHKWPTDETKTIGEKRGSGRLKRQAPQAERVCVVRQSFENEDYLAKDSADYRGNQLARRSWLGKKRCVRLFSASRFGRLRRHRGAGG